MNGDIKLGDGPTDELTVKATTQVKGATTIHDDVTFSSTFSADMATDPASVEEFCTAQAASTITENMDVVGLPSFEGEHLFFDMASNIS